MSDRCQLTIPPTQGCPSLTPDGLVRHLAEIARRLEGLSANCLTAQAALLGQNADYDADIARALRYGVSTPIATLIADIGSLIVRVGGDRPRLVL